MPRQNLISASLSEETLAEIQQYIEAIRSKLDFLVTLQPVEIQSLFKAGNSLLPFLDQAHSVVQQHPQVLPAVFDAEEFQRDYALSKNLSHIATQVRQLENALGNTLIATHSDALVSALDVYAAVRQHRDKVPGLNVVADDMAAFFKKSRPKAATQEKT